MTRHIGYTALSSFAFFIVTLIVLLITGAGPQMEGLLTSLNHEGIIRNILIDATLFGAFTGGMATLIFRKSMNHQVYTLITIILVVIFTEFVIVAIL